jgi:carboxymethylenebutenolidase
MGETIEIAAPDGHTLSAYVTGDPSAKAGLVVLQEIFGVNDHVRRMADTYAANGYYAIAPSMFDRVEKGVKLGYTAEDRMRGVEMRARITSEESLADLDAAARALQSSTVGVVGECWGGTLAWLGATHASRFKAASCWYGGGIAAMKDAQPKCPVELHFGDMDGSIPNGDVDVIRAAHPGVPIYIYPNAGHGFGCADRDQFDKDAFELALQRTLAFFGRHLGATASP